MIVELTCSAVTAITVDGSWRYQSIASAAPSQGTRRATPEEVKVVTKEVDTSAGNLSCLEFDGTLSSHSNNLEGIPYLHKQMSVVLNEIPFL